MRTPYLLLSPLLERKSFNEFQLCSGMEGTYFVFVDFLNMDKKNKNKNKNKNLICSITRNR